MLKNESFFRLFSIAFLGILFLSLNALADKKQAESKSPVLSVVNHIEEAEKINDNQLHVINLTSIGERVEIVIPKTK